MLVPCTLRPLSEVYLVQELASCDERIELSLSDERALQNEQNEEAVRHAVLQKQLAIFELKNASLHECIHELRERARQQWEADSPGTKRMVMLLCRMC
jgi:hypothetical protein